MEWRGVFPVDVRLEFVHEYARGYSSMTELCDAYGVSRKTG
jgi:transposase-like protein